MRLLWAPLGFRMTIGVTPDFLGEAHPWDSTKLAHRAPPMGFTPRAAGLSGTCLLLRKHPLCSPGKQSHTIQTASPLVWLAA